MAPPFAAGLVKSTFFSALVLTAASVVAVAAADPNRAARATASGRFLGAQLPAKLGADLQQALSEALGVGFGLPGSHVLAAGASLEPLWRTMAKGPEGLIDPRSLRYMVHRHFHQKYHISIIGMETLQVKSSSSVEEALLLAELTPNFIRSLLQDASGGAGFSFNDTAALVAVIERLVVDAGHEKLEASYMAKGRDVKEMLTREELLSVMEAYILRWLFGHDLEGLAMMEENRSLVEESIDEWQDLVGLVKGHILAFEHQLSHGFATGRVHHLGSTELWNPLRPLFSFADAQAVVAGISTKFGAFWETQCDDLMELVMSKARPGTGRVPMSRFHASALGGEWRLTESLSYLRQLGALDESSDVHGPQLIASNYIQSPSNCIVAQKHFRVCCHNPCLDFYSDLEMAIGAPQGDADEVLAIVSNFTYGMEDESPRITEKAQALLQEIAQVNNGKIPLHGRLFAQWLHMLFPTVCAFPHKSGTLTGLSPTEFGVDKYMASEEEMQRNAERGEPRAQDGNAEGDRPINMWSYEEELLSHRLHQDLQPREPSVFWRLRVVFVPLAMLPVFVSAVVQPAMLASGVASEYGYGRLLGRRASGKEGEALPAEVKTHSV